MQIFTPIFNSYYSEVTGFTDGEVLNLALRFCCNRLFWRRARCLILHYDVTCLTAWRHGVMEHEAVTLRLSSELDSLI